MPGEVHRISAYHFRETDHFIFDTNIWLFLYSPQYGPTDSRVRVYSAALKSVLAARSRILIDSLVLCEFINSMARLAYNMLPKRTKPTDFKAYRKSAAFKPTAKGIADACRRILGHATPTDTEFHSLNIGALLNDYEAGSTDFNDQVLAELCRKKGLALVTDDGDFKGTGLTILTENKHLLT